MNQNKEKKCLVIRAEASGADKGALICDIVMLAIFLWNQIRYGMNMLFLIIPLACIGLYLFAFGVLPETYCFAENGLEIIHRFRKKVQIPYETVFNYEASVRDGFIHITRHNGVKVYHADGSKKKVTVCRPCDVESFVAALKENCEIFHEQTQPSRLDVFFNHQDQNEKGDR